MKPISASSLSFIEPMQALRVAKHPGGDWLYEVKLDGYRALVFLNSSKVGFHRRSRLF